MLKDKLAKSRAKSRLIMELRYPPLVQAFDRRGSLLEALSDTFATKMDQWRTENVTVTLLNDYNSPTRQATLDHRHCLFIYEDPATTQEFFDDAKRFINLIHKIFPELCGKVDRVGMRLVSVINSEGYADFAALNERVISTFFATPLPISIPISDCQAVLQHETGRVSIGPTRKGDEWLNGIFTQPDNNVPDLGFGIDADSYIANLMVKSTNDVINAFTTVFEQTMLTELEVATALTIGDKNG
ncbi:MAG: hypothetical protein ACYC27_22295 [Armatimonadota bacterium]